MVLWLGFFCCLFFGFFLSETCTTELLDTVFCQVGNFLRCSVKMGGHQLGGVGLIFVNKGCKKSFFVLVFPSKLDCSENTPRNGLCSKEQKSRKWKRIERYS